MNNTQLKVQSKSNYLIQLNTFENVIWKFQPFCLGLNVLILRKIFLNLLYSHVIISYNNMAVLYRIPHNSNPSDRAAQVWKDLMTSMQSGVSY